MLRVVVVGSVILAALVVGLVASCWRPGYSRRESRRCS